MHITIPGTYIATRQTQDGIKKEQVVKVDGTCLAADGKTQLYQFYYGNFGYHEGFIKEENLRNLTDQEKSTIDNGKYCDLPQQFYQSFMGSQELNG